MIQNVLQHLGGIENYGVLSMLLFIVAFLGIVVWACRLKQPFLDSMASLPLEPTPTSANPDPSETAYE